LRNTLFYQGLILFFIFLIPFFVKAQNIISSENRGCYEQCGGGCTHVFFSLFFDHHRDILSKKELDPTITSVELRSYFAYGTGNTYSLRTSLGARLGMFSTEVRIRPFSFGSNLMENEYQSTDWMILKLNLLRKEVSRFWIGTGVFYHPTNERVYHQHFSGFMLNFNNRFILEMDGRISPEYRSRKICYHEENVRMQIRFLHTKKCYAYLSLSASYQHFSEQNEFWFVQSGLILNLHKGEKNFQKRK
jgi:hypothetical protein